MPLQSYLLFITYAVTLSIVLILQCVLYRYQVVEHFTELPEEADDQCDVVFSKPVYILQNDAGISFTIMIEMYILFEL